MTIRHTDGMGWDIASSTRQSVHPYTRYVPFNGTGTSSSVPILTVAPQTAAAVNLVLNPSMETAVISGDVSGYVASGAAIVRSTAQKAIGGNSLLVNPGANGAGEGFYWTLYGNNVGYSNEPLWIVAQCEHYGFSAANAVKLEIKDVTGATTLATSGSSDLATTWKPISAIYAIPPGAAVVDYRVYVTTQTNHNTDFYIDKFMVEVRVDSNVLNTYVDGNQGAGYDWEGTADLSISKRRRGLSNIRGLKIMNDAGSNPIYVSFDCKASTTSGIKVDGGETLETNWPLYFDKTVEVIAPAGSPTYHGVVWGTHA